MTRRKHRKEYLLVMTLTVAHTRTGTAAGRALFRVNKILLSKERYFFFVDSTRFLDDLEIRWKFFLVFVWEIVRK